MLRIFGFIFPLYTLLRGKLIGLPRMFETKHSYSNPITAYRNPRAAHLASRPVHVGDGVHTALQRERKGSQPRFQHLAQSTERVVRL